MTARYGIRTRLLAANAVVVAVAIVTTIAVAALVGPPMFQRLMDAAVQRQAGEHPYLHAFERATAMSVGTALGVAAIAALTVSWYVSRRVYRSTTQLAHAASVIADGHYDVQLAPTGLGKEFDEITAAFTTMAQRLGDVDRTRRQMLADLAHEIRTPVAVLEAYLEAVEDGVQGLDADTVAVLRDQTRRLTRFSIDVGALFNAEQQPNTVRARPTQIADLVDAAVVSFQPQYRSKGVELESAVDAATPQVCADPERIGQVLSNLLDNALRHTPEGGRVRLTVGAGDAMVTVTVADTGDGIAAEHLGRLFERFYRVDAARDRRHGGAGIGLAIAKAYVEAHGGRLTAQSAGLGRGSTFAFTLPVG
jgi:two-component system, OmpR family, sensor histidine kinase BaeS